MRYKITSVQDKSKDWKVVGAIDVSGTEIAEASVNRTNKKGETFPNFDGIVVNAEIEADLWQSPAGKSYLFAPKEQKAYGGAPRASSGGIKAAQDRKETSINKFADRKEESIAKAGAQRDAVLMVTTFYANREHDDDELKSWIEQWYKYFLNLGDIPFV